MSQVQNLLTLELYRHLDKEIRRRPRGTIREIDRAVGRCVGWWQSRAETGDVTVGQLLKILDHLGLDPVKVIRQVVGSEDGLELDRPLGQAPEIVTMAWERIRLGQEGSGVGEAWLETLDKQRYQEPEEVVKLTQWGVRHVELALLPRLLGVAGSALRLMICLDEAEYTIHAGIEIAKSQKKHLALGNLLLRLSYVVADQGDRSEALRLAEKATLIFLRIGRWDDLAKAAVEQGIWLYYLNRHTESLDAHSMALARLPEENCTYRITALQYLGLNYRSLGQPEEAIRYLNEAERVASIGDSEGWSRSKLNWLRAQILMDLGETDASVDLLSDIAEEFKEIHLGDAALATCDLVKAYLLGGKHELAYLAATSMRVLVEPLRHNKIISAAVGDLLRTGQVGLTLTLVERVAAQIEGERQTEVWHSLRITAPL